MRRREAPVSEARLAIQRVVEERPGIHFRGLARAASVSSAGQLRHHLDKLERDGQVVEVEDGRYRRYFPAGRHDPRLRADLARFSRTVPRRIARLLLDHPMNRTQLRRSLHCADSTLGYHLSRMVMLGDLARVRGPQSCVYSLAHEDAVRRMLLEQGADAEDDVGEPWSAPGPQPDRPRQPDRPPLPLQEADAEAFGPPADRSPPGGGPAPDGPTPLLEPASMLEDLSALEPRTAAEPDWDGPGRATRQDG